MSFKVAVLPGDGIGPEVVAEAVAVLQVVAPDLEFQDGLIGGAAYDATGQPLPQATLDLCKSADAVLLGAVGGPKWDTVEPVSMRPEVGALLPLRRELNVFANLRPAKIFGPLRGASPLKNPKIDVLVVRELTGGIYFGQPRERRDGGEVAVDTCIYSREEIRRIAKIGFESARRRGRKLVSVDKANVLETSRLWREVVAEVAEEFQDVALEFMLVDNCAMQLVRDPSQFDVILTENMFGDILSDEAAQITGSLGMLPSASLSGTKGLFEPAHGSAPDIAGMGIANPLATILSAAMLLKYSAGREAEASAVDESVERALADGFMTRDLGGTTSTKEMGTAVIERLYR